MIYHPNEKVQIVKMRIKVMSLVAAKDLFHRIRQKVIVIEGISHYQKIIPPEIGKNHKHQMGLELAKLVANENLRTILEIGSSSGDGTTSYLLNALKARKNKENLKVFLIEISSVRFRKLVENIPKELTFVTPLQLSTVRPKDLPKYNEIFRFIRSTKTKLNDYGFLVVASWLWKDKKYLKKNPSLWMNETGLEFVRRALREQPLDIIIIDGGEFTGEFELSAFESCQYVFLDDVNSYKNYANFLKLKESKHYTLISENLEETTGWAAFKKSL